MDEQLTGAYEVLVDSASPPHDARERVAARRTQRRRRRTAGYVAVAGVAIGAVLVGVLTLGGGESSAPLAKDPTPSGAPSPTEVTCVDGSEPQRVDYDHMGYKSFTELLTKEAEANGAYTVDRPTKTIFFLRDDGTAHSAIPWTHGAGARWFPSSKSWCPDSAQWQTQPLDVSGPSAPVSLEVGHCWIESVELFGRSWDVIEEDQFGWGEGPNPQGVTGTGTAWLTGDVVTYVDEGGKHLTLVPEGDPWAVERTPCD